MTLTLTLSAKLHLSLARESIRAARGYFNEITRNGWIYNEDQIDLIRDCAHAAQRDARRHLEAALWERRRGLGRQFGRRVAA